MSQRQWALRYGSAVLKSSRYDNVASGVLSSLCYTTNVVQCCQSKIAMNCICGAIEQPLESLDRVRRRWRVTGLALLRLLVWLQRQAS